MQAHPRIISTYGCRTRATEAAFTLKDLKVLRFLELRVIIEGFPLPTPVLTPGWAIV